jgi:hypothetical protein
MALIDTYESILVYTYTSVIKIPLFIYLLIYSFIHSPIRFYSNKTECLLEQMSSCQ